MPLLNNDMQMDVLLKIFSATNFTPPTSWKFAAVTTIPDDDAGNGLKEPTDGSYDRIEIANNATQFGPSEDGTEVVNLLEWAFPQASQEWGIIFGIAMFDNSDNYMGYLPYSTPKYVGANEILKVAAGSFIVASEDTPLSIYIEEASVPTILTDATTGQRVIMGYDDGDVTWTSTNAFGPPSPPRNLANDSGTLTWDDSSYDGGSPIVSYTVWKSDSTSQLVEFDILAPDAGSYTVDVGTTGTFFITAENVVGSSVPSNEVTI